MFIYSDIIVVTTEECISTAISSAEVSLGVDIDPAISVLREYYYFNLYYCTKIWLYM